MFVYFGGTLAGTCDDRMAICGDLRSTILLISTGGSAPFPPLSSPESSAPSWSLAGPSSCGVPGLSFLIVTHPFSLRLYHVFLPVPFAIAYLKSTLQDEISTSSLAKLARTTSSDAV